MSYPGPNVELPYDEWFDNDYKYNPDRKPIENTIAEISLHEKLYRHATKNGNTLTIGGSENRK